MNNKTYLYTYLFTLIGGVLLVVLQDRAGLFDAITVLVGILFLVPGLLSFLRAFFPSKAAVMAGEKRSTALIIVSVAAVVFGLLLIVVPELFNHFIVYAFGILMMLTGLMQLFNFMPSMRSLGFPWWYLATPLLCMCIGVVIMVLGPGRVLDILALLTGIVLIVYSINGLTGYFDRSSRVKKGGNTGQVVEVS